MAKARKALPLACVTIALGLAGVAATGYAAGTDRIEGQRAGAIPRDGYWAELAPPLRASHAAVLDPVRRRLIVIAGYDGSFRGDVWTLSLDGAPVWTCLAVDGPQPVVRMEHTAIYDPVGDRVLVFGGQSAIPYYDVWLDDVWELSLAGNPTWTQLEPDGGRPGPRSAHTAIYDSARRRMVVFGGFGIPPGGTGTEYQDTWALELDGAPSWNELPTTSSLPRSSHVAVYDEPSDRMVIHGGTGGNPFNNASWALSFATGEWQELLPGGLPAPDRTWHAATFDPVRRRLVFFAGVRFEDGEFIWENDVWALELADSPAWTRLSPGRTPPSPRRSHSLVYDFESDRIVASCGWDGQARGDVWALAFSEPLAWTELRVQAPGPVTREGAVMTHDPTRKQMLLYGGRIGSEFVSELWSLPLVGRPEWQRTAVVGRPPGRQGATLTYDPRRDRFILHGGVHWGPPHDDLWGLTLSSRAAWSRLEATGPTPGRIGEHSGVYDPIGDRLIVFGGVDSVGRNRNSVWALTLSGYVSWSEITPIGEPPAPRSEHSAIYDPLGHRMLVFGGFFPYQNDVWELTLGATPEWRRLPTLGTPPSARRGHTAVYDPIGHRMLVFGGRSLDQVQVVQDHNELWELSLDATPIWRLLAPEGPPPLGRMLHSAALDPRGNRMIVIGGESNQPFAFPAPTWQIVLGPAAPVLSGTSKDWNLVRITWQTFGSAGSLVSIHRRTEGDVRVIASLVADGEGTVTYEDADVVAGGRYEYWAEQDGLESEPWSVEVPLPLLAVAGSRPSPAQGNWVIAYSLANDHPARLEIFDVRGRKLFDMPIANPQRGNGVMTPRDAHGLEAGVYLARITQDGRHASAKLAVIR